MTIEDSAKDYLGKLREGKEIYWDYIPRLVSGRVITRDQALSALKEGLEILIPEYEGLYKKKNPDSEAFWYLRLKEAKDARDNIKAGKFVEYRGHGL